MISMTGTREQITLLLMKQTDDKKLWDLKEHKAKRTISQNSYYWSLAGKVASKTARFGANINEIHNRNLRELGLREYVNDQPIVVYIPDTDEAEKATLNAESYHIKPTSQTKVGKNGDIFRCYVMLRGSHTFNTSEMSALVDLMVQEAKAVGIETMTPLELERIRQLEAEAERKHNVHK
jgi:hypothetical protein